MSITELFKIPTDFESFDVIPDSIYGSGADGNVTISSNTTLTRDMNYNNLTINDGIHLDTAGYRVFVRNKLMLSATSSNQATTSIGRKNGASTNGTLKGGVTGNATDSVGGAGNGTSATAPSEGLEYFNHPDIAISGVIIHAGNTTPSPIYGGSGDTTNAGGGIVVLCARKITGYGTVYATGHTSGSYTTGGGAIFLVSQSIPLTGLATDVSGYNDGNVKTFKV
jgi:hypothetical protein